MRAEPARDFPDREQLDSLTRLPHPLPLHIGVWSFLIDVFNVFIHVLYWIFENSKIMFTYRFTHRFSLLIVQFPLDYQLELLA